MRQQEALKIFGKVFQSKYQKFYRHALGASRYNEIDAKDSLQNAAESMVMYILRGAEFEDEDHLINSFHRKIQWSATRPTGRGRDNRHDVMYVDEYTYHPLVSQSHAELTLQDIMGSIVVHKSHNTWGKTTVSIDWKKTHELRRIFKMEIEGFSRKEIADAFNTTPQKITDRINRYRRKIK